MPRALPPLANHFATEIAKAEHLVRRLEAAHVTLSSLGKAHPQIGLTSIELSYELAFLRIFLAWEIFLEQTFLRLLCGYAPLGGVQEQLLPGITYSRNIAAAETMVLGGRNFRLWYNPAHLIGRARGYFANGNFEFVISSNQSALEELAAIRHRIAHAQEHARQEFDDATMSLASRRYPGSRPGRFLRDWRRNSVPPSRWLSSISADLLGLARQICP